MSMDEFEKAVADSIEKLLINQLVDAAEPKHGFPALVRSCWQSLEQGLQLGNVSRLTSRLRNPDNSAAKCLAIRSSRRGIPAADIRLELRQIGLRLLLSGLDRGGDHWGGVVIGDVHVARTNGQVNDGRLKVVHSLIVGQRLLRRRGIHGGGGAAIRQMQQAERQQPNSRHLDRDPEVLHYLMGQQGGTGGKPGLRLGRDPARGEQLAPEIGCGHDQVLWKQ